MPKSNIPRILEGRMRGGQRTVVFERRFNWNIFFFFHFSLFLVLLYEWDNQMIHWFIQVTNTVMRWICFSFFFFKYCFWQHANTNTIPFQKNLNCYDKFGIVEQIRIICFFENNQKCHPIIGWNVFVDI